MTSKVLLCPLAAGRPIRNALVVWPDARNAFSLAPVQCRTIRTC